MNAPDPTPPQSPVLGYASPDTHPHPRPLTAAFVAAIATAAGLMGAAMLTLSVVVVIFMLRDSSRDWWHGLLPTFGLLVVGSALLMAAVSCGRSVPKLFRGRP